MNANWATPSFLLVAVGAVALLEVTTRGALTRWAWREVFRLLTVLDVAAVRLVRAVYPPRYEILGACQKRGLCCKQIVGNPPAFVKRTFLLQLFAAYHKVFHNFTPVARGPEGEVIFACGYIRSDGRCSIYRYRPYLCRNYPMRPWFEPPKLLPGCGFRIAHRTVARMQPRSTLPIIDGHTGVHHPSPPRSVGVQQAPAPTDAGSVTPRAGGFGTTPAAKQTLRVIPERLLTSEERAEQFEAVESPPWSAPRRPPVGDAPP